MKRGRPSQASLTVAKVTPKAAIPAPSQDPPPPPYLSESAAAFWRATLAVFDLDLHHRHLLRLACEAMDRGTLARETLAAEGNYFIDDKGNKKAHPAVAVELQSRTSFARLIRELDLDGAAAPLAPRPPALRSNR